MLNFKKPDVDPVDMRLNYKGFEDSPSLIDVKFPISSLDVVDWNNHAFNKLQPYTYQGIDFGYTLIVAVDNLSQHGLSESWVGSPFAYVALWFPKVYGKQFLTGMQVWSVFGWRAADTSLSGEAEYSLTGFDIDLSPLESSVFYENRVEEFNDVPDDQYQYYLGRIQNSSGYGGRGAYFSKVVDWGAKTASVNKLTIRINQGYYIGKQSCWDGRRAGFRELIKAPAWPFGMNSDPGVGLFLQGSVICQTNNRDLYPSNFYDLTNPIQDPTTRSPV